MKKISIVVIIVFFLVITAMPFSKLLSKFGERQNIIIAGSSWTEANYNYPSAFSGNTKNTAKYSENISIVDGEPIKDITVGNRLIASKAMHITDSATSDYQKAIDIYVWISENIKYTNSAFGTKYPAIYAFKTREAICTGFAGLYSAMARDVGLSVRQIGGTAQGQGHTWNQVYVKNQWMNVDCTFASSLFLSAKESKVTLSKEEAYLELTSNIQEEIVRGNITYTFGNSDYFNTPNFMDNRKAKYLIYEYNNSKFK